MTVRRVSWIAALAIGLMGFGRATLATTVGGPFTVDADTLHLWHMDDAAGPTTTIADSVVTNQLNLTNIDQSAQAANSAGGNTAATANVVIATSALSGFGNAANFANNAIVPTTVNTGSETTSPHRPILNGTSALANNDSDAVGTWSFSNATTGAFTWEAVVKFDSSFDPTSTSYRNSGTAAGNNYPMEIISGEGDTNAHRNWQFRFDQIGTGTSSGANGTTKPRIEFANLHGISGNQSIALDLPTTGLNAVNNTDWFHIAVEYNGIPNTPNNLAFFWTDISNPANASLTDPVLVGTAQMTNSLLTAAANLPDFAVGDEARDAGSGSGEGESFVGQIDEVRMSDNVRYTVVPEPAMIVLAGLGMLGMACFARRRK